MTNLSEQILEQLRARPRWHATSILAEQTGTTVAEARAALIGLAVEGPVERGLDRDGGPLVQTWRAVAQAPPQPSAATAERELTTNTGAISCKSRSSCPDHPSSR